MSTSSQVTGPDFVTVKLADRELLWASSFKGDKNIFTNAIWTSNGGGGWLKLGTGPRRRSSKQHSIINTCSDKQYVSFQCEWELPQNFDLQESLMSQTDSGDHNFKGASLVMWEKLSSPKDHIVYGIIDSPGFCEASVADSKLSQQYPDYWETEVRLKMTFNCMTNDFRLQFEEKLSSMLPRQTSDTKLRLQSLFLEMAHELVSQDRSHLGHVYDCIVAVTFYMIKRPAVPPQWQKVSDLSQLGASPLRSGFISVDMWAKLRSPEKPYLRNFDYSAVKIVRRESWLAERCTKWAEIEYSPPTAISYASKNISYWRLPQHFDFQVAFDTSHEDFGSGELLLVICFPLQEPKTGVLYSSVDVCKAVRQGLYDAKLHVPVQAVADGLWETEIHLNIPMVYMPEAQCRTFCQSCWSLREKEYTPSTPYAPWPDPLQPHSECQASPQSRVDHVYDIKLKVTFYTGGQTVQARLYQSKLNMNSADFKPLLPKELDAYHRKASDYRGLVQLDYAVGDPIKSVLKSEYPPSDKGLYIGSSYRYHFGSGFEGWQRATVATNCKVLDAPKPEGDTWAVYFCPATYDIQLAFTGSSKSGGVVYQIERDCRPERGGITYCSLDIVAAVRNGSAVASPPTPCDGGYWETKISVVCPIIHLQRRARDVKLEEYRRSAQQAEAEGKPCPPWPGIDFFLAGNDIDEKVQGGHVMDQHLELTIHTRQKLDLTAMASQFQANRLEMRLQKSGKLWMNPPADDASLMSTSRPVRLLSFDAGGVRGLAQLKTLDRALDTPALAGKAPADIFDLIVGSGSGGVLALLLGRFGLTVQQAVACYKSLMFATPVFQQVPEVGTPTSQPRASTMLDHVIDMLLIMSGLPHSAPLLHDSPHGCHTAVVTMRSMHPSGVPSVFRSYAPAHSGQLHKVEIQKLIRLCLAEFIQEAPMDIEGITYLDGGLTTWNPANIANHEARFKLHEGRKVEVLLSIGSGVKQPIDMVQEISAGVWGYTGKRLHALATSAHDTHRTVEHTFHYTNGKYYRLDPPFVGDLPSNAMNDQAISQLMGITEGWLDEHEQTAKFAAIASILAKQD